jgi:hypothetical protein
LATSKAVRADDVSGLNIGTVSFTEDAVTKDFQRVVINNSTDGTMATVNATGLRVDASGAAVPITVAATLNVKPSDGTNPITKTFDLDSGAGTEYNIGVGLRKIASGGSVEAGTATDPWRTDPVGNTAQPITASSLPLPTGAATDASVTGLQVAQASATSGQKGSLVQGAVTTNAPSYTTAQTDPLSLDTSGLLRVSLKDTPANTNKFLVTPDSVALPANQSVNVNQLAGTTTSVNSGNKDAGTLRVVIATDQPALTNKLLVTPDANAAVNVAQINGVTALMGNGVTGTGSHRVTIASDNTAFSVNATVKPATSGGLTIKHLVSAGSTNATSVKGSAGQVYGWTIFNTNAATRYVKLHNTAGTPTAGSGVVLTIAVPPSGGNNWSSETGIAFATGIAFTTVTGTADSDSTGAGANDLTIDIFYN